MGIITEELKLLDVFRKNPLSSLEFKKIMLLSKKRSRNWVFNALQKFCKKFFIHKIKVNNSYLYKANLRSPGLISFFHPLDFADTHINNAGWSKNIYDILNEIRVSVSKITPFFIMLVFGSYAEKTNKKDSDLDIAIIVESNKKLVQPYIEKVVRKEIIKVDYHIITKDEFKQMLLREEENLGKEVFRKHLIIWGGDQYYELIKEAEENGFKG